MARRESLDSGCWVRSTWKFAQKIMKFRQECKRQEESIFLKFFSKDPNNPLGCLRGDQGEACMTILLKS